MGHIHLGRLPQTRRWLDVVDLIAESPGDTARIGAAVMYAASNRLIQLAKEQTVAYPVWLMARVATASRGTSFIRDLNALGVRAGKSSTALDVIAAIADEARRGLSQEAPAGHFSEFAVQALRTALTATVATRGKALFASSISDAQRSFRDFSTQTRFGELARKYFANFMSRALLSFVDRELPKKVGTDALPTAADATEFRRALDTHTWEAAAIVEQFAADWYSKHNWQSENNITRREAHGFVREGLRKLRLEFKRRAT